MAVSPSMREALAMRIAGEVILSNVPGRTLKKWRGIFNITQARMAEELKISPSVISDYEGGRRSPGTRYVKRLVEGMISIEEESGGRLLRELTRLTRTTADVIIDIKEFPVSAEARAICKVVDGVPLACKELLEREIFGYTVIDSVRAILTLSGTDFYQVFGSTTERALIFVNVRTGRSPMVAVRVHPLKTRMVILHGPKEVDELAVQLAEVERVPLVLSRMPTVDGLVSSLNNFYRSTVTKGTPLGGQ
jgi:putative transcriptional regulator